MTIHKTCKVKLAFIVSVIGFFSLFDYARSRDIKYIQLPTKSYLTKIQLNAFSCSRDNNRTACDQTRLLADPLMDHPLLSTSCKDSVWELLQKAKSTVANTFERRDSINRPAKRLSEVCVKITKPKRQQNQRPGNRSQRET